MNDVKISPLCGVKLWIKKQILRHILNRIFTMIET